MQTLIVRKKGSTVAVVAVAVVFGRARGYVRTYVRSFLTYVSEPSCPWRLSSLGGLGASVFLRTYVLRQEVRYFLRASVKEDECCLLHARLGVLVQRLLRARRGRAMAVRSDY